MKKIISAFLSIVLIACCTTAVAAQEVEGSTVSTITSEESNNVGYNDFLTDKGPTTYTAAIPSAEDIWNLDAGTYNGSFDFSANVYSNVCLTTTTGQMKVYISSKQSDTMPTKTFSVKLYDRSNKSLVSSFTATRNGGTAHTFTGLKSDKKYYLRLQKNNDEITLTGSFTVDE